MEKRGRKRKVAINGAKLDKEIQRRGMTRVEASAEIGRYPDYITRAVRDNELSKDGLKRIDEKFRIRYEDIQCEDAAKTVTADRREEPAQVEMQMHADLSEEVLAKAVAKGVLDGLEAYFGKRAEPVAVLAERWKGALHNMEAEQ